MAPIDFSHSIRITPSGPPSRTAWTVAVAGERRAIYTGDGAKERATHAALRLAEELRTTGPVLVVVEPASSRDRDARLRRGVTGVANRLARGAASHRRAHASSKPA